MAPDSSRPGGNDTKAKSVVRPRAFATVGGCGLAMALILSIAACAQWPSVAPTNAVPSWLR